MIIPDAYKTTEKFKEGGELSFSILTLLLYLSEIISSLKNMNYFIFIIFPVKDPETDLSAEGFTPKKLPTPLTVFCDFRYS